MGPWTCAKTAIPLSFTELQTDVLSALYSLFGAPICQWVSFEAVQILCLIKIASPKTIIMNKTTITHKRPCDSTEIPLCVIPQSGKVPGPSMSATQERIERQ